MFKNMYPNFKIVYIIPIIALMFGVAFIGETPKRFGSMDNEYHFRKSFKPLENAYGSNNYYPPMFHILSWISFKIANLFLYVSMYHINFWLGAIITYIVIPHTVLKNPIIPYDNLFLHFLPLWWCTEYAFQLASGLYAQGLALPFLYILTVKMIKNELKSCDVFTILFLLLTHKASVLFCITMLIFSTIYRRFKGDV